MFGIRYAVLSGKILRVLLLLLLTVPVAGIVAAQGGGTLEYGNYIMGTLSAETPLLLYTFEGSPGDLVTVHVLGLTPEMSPSVSLMTPDQEQLAVSSGNAFTASAGEAMFSYRLTQGGQYSLLVSNAEGSSGDFLLRLDGSPSEVGVALLPETPATVDVAVEADPQVYTFDASPEQPMTLIVSTESPDFAYVAHIRDGSGQLIAALAGVPLRAAGLTIEPGFEAYEVRIAALQPDMEGSVTLLLTAGSVAAPQATPAPTQQVILPPEGVCAVTGAANVRSGPGTNFSILGGMNFGTYLLVVGRSTDGAWYAVNFGGQQGWVSAGVVTISGPCDNLPIASFGTPSPTSTQVTPTATLSTGTPATATTTATVTTTVTPSATVDTTMTPTATATVTPTATWTTAP